MTRRHLPPRAGGSARRKLAGSVLVACLLLLSLQGVSSAQTEPTVTIATTTAQAEEGEAAIYVVTRTGDTTAALTVSLEWAVSLSTVTYSFQRPASVEIPIGAASAEVNVPLRDSPEADSPTESVTATVTAGTGYVVGDPASATVSVVDDGDQRIEAIFGAPLTMFENVGSQDVTVPLRLRTTGTHRQAAPDPWGFSFSTRNGSASSGDDFTRLATERAIATADWTEVNGAWEWELPAADQTLSTVLDDADPEPPEDFYFLMEGTAFYGFSPVINTEANSVRHKVTIYDDDIQFVVEVAGADDLSATEGEEIVLRLTAESKWLHACRTSGSENNIDDMELVLYLNLEAVTADLGSDVTWSDGTTALQRIDFEDFSALEGDPTGACRVRATADLGITVVDDGEFEDTESFNMRFVTTDPAPELPSALLTATIIDDDPPTLSVADVAAPEGDEALTFTVTLSPAHTGTVTVDYATGGGSATAGTDYTTTTGTLTFAASETTKTVTVVVLADTDDEDDETLTLALSNASPAEVEIGTAGTGTIIDDDGLPRLSVAGAAAPEGDEALTFTVTLSPAHDGTVTVDYATAGGSATAGTDYTATSGTLTFAASETSKTVTVAVLDDVTDEDDETVTLALSNPANAGIGNGRAAGTILDDDEVHLTLVENVSAPESSGNLTFEVTLDAASDRTIGVDYATADGTATAGDDYTATSGTLTFAPGVVSRTIAVPIRNDALGEHDETLTVTLSNPVNATLDTDARTGTITNDDAPSVYARDAEAVERGRNYNRNKVAFVVDVIPIPTVSVTVKAIIRDGTATADVDFEDRGFTLEFSPGTDRLTAEVRLKHDYHDEGDETLFLVITDATNATVGRGTATGTIIDDDGPAHLYVDDPSTRESSGELTFTVRLSPTPDNAVTVDYATADGSATAGTDYTTTTGTLTFEPRVSEIIAERRKPTNKTVTVPILDDASNESNETVILTLTNPSSGVTVNDPGTGTIVDDDARPRRPSIRPSGGGGSSSGGSSGGGSQVEKEDPVSDGDEDDPAPEAVTAPAIARLQDALVLHVGDRSTVVDMTSVFSGSIETYGANAADADIVGVSIDGSALSLKALAEGSTAISIHATNTSGAALQVFTVTVRDIATPTIAGFLADITLTAGDEPTALDVSAGFGGTIDSYGAQSSDTGIVTVTLAGSRLSLTGLAAGTTNVAVTATNTKGSALQTIRVTVLAQDS